MTITLHIDEPKWRRCRGLATKLKRAAAFTLAEQNRDDGSLTILLTNDARLHALNLSFCGKDKPTNVLSFPSAQEDYLGDIALAYGVTAAEAEAQGKDFADHATHLVVHGVLHLLGYDHETSRDARRMEPLETAILSKLGVRDPYARQAA